MDSVRVAFGVFTMKRKEKEGNQSIFAILESLLPDRKSL
jgi:hypothetical protein